MALGDLGAVYETRARIAWLKEVGAALVVKAPDVVFARPLPLDDVNGKHCRKGNILTPGG